MIWGPATEWTWFWVYELWILVWVGFAQKLTLNCDHSDLAEVDAKFDCASHENHLAGHVSAVSLHILKCLTMTWEPRCNEHVFWFSLKLQKFKVKLEDLHSLWGAFLIGETFCVLASKSSRCLVEFLGGKKLSVFLYILYTLVTVCRLQTWPFCRFCICTGDSCWALCTIFLIRPISSTWLFSICLVSFLDIVITFLFVFFDFDFD